MPRITPLIKAIQQRHTQNTANQPTIVAIDGLGGSGKSSLAAALQASYLQSSGDDNLQIVSIDSFACTEAEYPFHKSGTQTRVSIARLIDNIFVPLRAGRSALYKPTPWWRGQAEGEEKKVEPRGIILVEGCYALHRELRCFYDLRIWIDCPVEKALTQAVQRDGHDIEQVWRTVYAPNEQRYLASHNPRAAADIIWRAED